MKTRTRKSEGPSVEWLQRGNCRAVGVAGNLCPNCEDTGMIHSEPVEASRTMYEDMKRQPWTSLLGQKWRDGFKKKTVETVFQGMEVMIVKGKKDKLLQIGRVVNVMPQYVDVDYYVEREQRAYRKRVHMHSVIVIHRGVKVTVDQNGVLFVERRDVNEAERAGVEVSDDDEE